MRIFKVLTPDAWAAAQQEGLLAPSVDDQRDGYIHLSSSDQLAGTLDAYFVGFDEVVLLELDVAALGDALRWEPSRDQRLFPHYYGVPDLGAVVGDWRLERDGAGAFRLPKGLS